MNKTVTDLTYIQKATISVSLHNYRIRPDDVIQKKRLLEDFSYCAYIAKKTFCISSKVLYLPCEVLRNKLCTSLKNVVL